jgi:murein DD-endopeptidase MepM/ murein hydrolase activator NlpD
VKAPYTVVVPGQHNDVRPLFVRDPFVLGSFVHDDPSKEMIFKWHYRSVHSNVFAEPANVQYLLPFPVSTDAPRTFVSQVEGGTFSHQGATAIDFGLPENSTVLSMRAGVVNKVVQDNWLSKFAPGVCPQPVLMSCATKGSEANVVQILHDDGTVAQYAHLAHNSAKVKVGDRVTAGQPIALSGNTGFSTSPHLHVDVTIRKGGDGSNNTYVPLVFRDPSLPVVPRADEVPDNCVTMVSREGRIYYACLTPDDGATSTFERPRRAGAEIQASDDRAAARVVSVSRSTLENQVVQPSVGAMFLKRGMMWNDTPPAPPKEE